MSTVIVRDLIIGEGIPKICVPITGTTRDSIAEQAKAVTQLPVDIAEWRADYFQNLHDEESIISIMGELRGILGEMPLLMTIRTCSEGGEADIGPDEYAAVNLRAARSGLVDMIDVEAFSYNDPARLIEGIHSAGVRVISSYHNFRGTPDREEIISRLTAMQELGADIVKIAVMPGSYSDVATLLAAADEMQSSHPGTPVVAISMSDAGTISRLTGEVFGSAITFGSGAEASAPGQIPADDLKKLLMMLHSRL